MGSRIAQGDTATRERIAIASALHVGGTFGEKSRPPVHREGGKERSGRLAEPGSGTESGGVSTSRIWLLLKPKPNKMTKKILEFRKTIWETSARQTKTMVDAWLRALRCLHFAAIAGRVVGVVGEAGNDPSASHIFTFGHIVHAPVLDNLNPVPLWAPVLMASNKTNNTVGGIASLEPNKGGATVDHCEVSYHADDIFIDSNMSVMLSMGNGAFDTFAMVHHSTGMDSGTEMDSKYDITTRSLPALYSKSGITTKSLPAFYLMAVIGTGAQRDLLHLHEGNEIILKELFDASLIRDADIKYSFQYNQTNSKEDPGSDEQGGVPLQWVECLDGALVLFRLGLLIFAVCSEQEQSGPDKCFAMWARRNRSYRNKWRFAIWARHNRSYRNKWFKLALLALLVPRVRAMAAMTMPPNSDGTGTSDHDEVGANRAESGVPSVQPPLLTLLCSDDVDSGVFDSAGAPILCSFFSAQPSACASYSIARAQCPVACDACSPLLPWRSHTLPPPSPYRLHTLPLPSPPPLKATSTSSLYRRNTPWSSSLLPLHVPLPSPPLWPPPLMALPCTMLPCTEASDVSRLNQGLQLTVPSHRRELQTYVSTVAGLTSALANTAMGHIILASGTYYLSSELSITRSVILEAVVAGSVVLDAQANSTNQRRVLFINPSWLGVVQVIGLNITRGYMNVCAQNFP